MSKRGRVSMLIVGWAGACLALTGCSLHISCGESATQAVAPPATNRPAAQPPGGVRQVRADGRPVATPVPTSIVEDGVVSGPAHGGPAGPPGPPQGFIPTEKAKTSLPPYVIEPPDVLLLNPIRMIPRGPYAVGPLDILLVRLAEPLPNQPLDGTFTVSPDGTINLGYSYGLVRVGGLTLEEIEKTIRLQLNRVAGLKDPQIAVGLAQLRGVQQTRGEHLVGQDGTINLGSYGCVYIAGLTLAQAKVAIERHLGQYLQDPEVTVDVLAYNSKVYYIITDGAGYGQQVYRFPITGNETVLDAMSFIQGLPAVASKKKIWVARPAPANHGCLQILPVDWRAITEGGATGTNYQLFPGDRIYVAPDGLIAFDNALAKLFAPIERLLGVTLLGANTYYTFQNQGQSGNVGFIAPLR